MSDSESQLGRNETIAGASLDFTHLLASNDAPLDSQIPIICAIISDSEKRVDALNAQIYVLQAALAQLVRSRNEATGKICQYRSILSPVRRVPAELICAIFDLALSSGNLDESTPSTPPLFLGHICQS
jgi:hypothetical protein